jgi:hypothetical protein
MCFAAIISKPNSVDLKQYEQVKIHFYHCCCCLCDISFLEKLSIYREEKVDHKCGSHKYLALADEFIISCGNEMTEKVESNSVVSEGTTPFLHQMEDKNDMTSQYPRARKKTVSFASETQFVERKYAPPVLITHTAAAKVSE